MSSNLNPRQLEALKLVDAPLLVLAGAGSGKTSVITQKIAYLIQERGLPARSILAVTFTNKAAKEMRERVGRLLDSGQARGLTVSTFHQFGLNFLRSELAKTPLKPNFSIMDSDDAKRLIKELMHRDNMTSADSKTLINKAMSLISSWKNELIEPSEAMTKIEDPEDMIFVEVYKLYQRSLRAYNAVDFDDLIVLPSQVLAEHPEIEAKWQNRLQYVLVDEYQDTNHAQYELIKRLVGKRGHFTAVGDDDQSIYAWRGAKPENMAQLGEDYPNLKVVKLEQNYRSTSRILEAANKVITNNPHLFEKKLWSDKGQGKQIRVKPCSNEDREAEWVANDIMVTKLKEGLEWKDFAVLYRSNFQARFLEANLRHLQVPYKLSGGTSFFARTEIKDIMCYLRLIMNSDDDSAFLRVVNTPKRGIGAVSLEKLGLFAQERALGLLEAASRPALAEHVPKRAAAELSEFARMIAHYTEELYQNDDPIPLVRQMVGEIGYIDLIKDESKTPQQEKNRLDNIEVLYQNIQGLINRAEPEDQTLEAALRKLLLLDMLEQQRDEDDTNQVSLSTLHAAKGLEFNHVYMMGLEEEMLPHRNSILSETVEEERRLMYVGITRARESLCLSYAKERRAGAERKPTSISRFLEELPSEDLIWPGKNNAPVENPVLTAKRHIDNLRAMLANQKKA